MKVYTVHEVLESTKNKLAEVTAERDAMAAQVEAFKKIREDWKGLAINDTKTLIAFIEAADKAPRHHLAEIRAQAVIEFASFIYRQFENGEYHRLARHKFQQLNSRAQGQTASIHNDVEYCGILGNAEFYAEKVQQGGE